MISLKKLLEKQMLLDPFDLAPFNEGDYARALKWIKNFKPKLDAVGERPTYMITDKIIEKANKKAYEIFCKRLDVMEQSKQRYETRSNS